MRLVPLLVALALGLATLWTAAPSPPQSATDRALGQAMATMHAQMEQVRYSERPDADFARIMIPHHQGAIEMAKVELQFGFDPNPRRLAQEIIVTQQSEIDVMKLALRNYPSSPIAKKRNNWCSP